MKYFELDKNEKRIARDFEKGKFKRIKGFKTETVRYRRYAKESLAKTRHINIRLSSVALQKIRAKALEKGLPYQTLISSLLHQYSLGRIKEKVN